jgi:hypothetical protein
MQSLSDNVHYHQVDIFRKKTNKFWPVKSDDRVLQRYLQLETIYSFQESFEGKRLCKDNFRFTKKRTPFVLPRNDNHFHPFATIMQRFNLEKLP